MGLGYLLPGRDPAPKKTTIQRLSAIAMIVKPFTALTDGLCLILLLVIMYSVVFGDTRIEKIRDNTHWLRSLFLAIYDSGEKGKCRYGIRHNWAANRESLVGISLEMFRWNLGAQQSFLIRRLITINQMSSPV